MLKTGLLLSSLLFSLGARSECLEYRKIHGLIDLKKKTWELTHVNKASEKICGTLPLPLQPNLEISITHGKKSFSTQIYKPLEGYWHESTADKQLKGGLYELTHLAIDTFVPYWFKGSTMIVKEIPTNKVIIKAQL